MAAASRPLLGGIAEQVHLQGAALAARGHEVTVVTGRVPRRERKRGGSEPEVLPYEEIRIGTTSLVRAHGSRAAIVWGPFLGRELRALLRTSRFDLVHVHSPWEPGLPSEAVRASAAPLVTTHHTAGTPHGLYRAWVRASRVDPGRIALRVAVSAAAESFAQRVQAGEYVRVPNAIDLRRFSPAGFDPARRAGASLRAILVGCLEPRKGHATALRALSLLSGSPRVELVCVGGGSLRARLARASRSLPVEWAGVIPPRDLPDRYRSADLALVPALGRESFGVVLLEALASGLPTVASDLPGFREVLGDSGAGLCVAAGDPSALARAVDALAVDVDLRARMSASARRRAERFAAERVAVELEAAYARVLGPSRRETEPSGVARAVSAALAT